MYLLLKKNILTITIKRNNVIIFHHFHLEFFFFLTLNDACKINYKTKNQTLEPKAPEGQMGCFSPLKVLTNTFLSF